MPEMHLRQLQLTYSTCGPFTKHKQRIQKFIQTGDTNYIYKNELDRACFAHDAAYSDSRDLTKRTTADKVLREKAFNFATYPKYDGYQRGLASMVYKFFDKHQKEAVLNLCLKISNYPKNFINLLLENFKKRKVHWTFKSNIWVADLADMQLIRKYKKGVRFLLCVIDIFSKYAWIVPLKDKKSASIVAAFQSILKKSDRKPNKIWIDKGSEFYNTSFKKWLQDNYVFIYSTHNEGKSVVAKRFIRTLKNKIYKYMTSISKNMYIDKLDDIVNEYNNTYHRPIKMEPINVEGNTYINTDKEVNDKGPKFKVGDDVRISK